MSGLIDIARSGILAYRNALEVTGQNIANVNTDGYNRREVVLEENAGGKMSAVTAELGGNGVSVDSIRRAFDTFVSQRLSTGTSQLASSDSFISNVESLETTLMSGNTGLAGALEGFFTDFATVSQTPNDPSARSVALNAGRAFATTVAALASDLAGLRDNIAEQAHRTANAGSTVLTNLAAVQREIASSGSSGSLAGLMDRRDAMLSSLSELVGIRTDYTGPNEISVSLGTTGDGPVLLSKTTTAQIEIDGTANGPLAVIRSTNGRLQGNQLDSGALNGQIRAWGVVDQAISRLDALASGLAADMNAIHGQGLDLAGNPGGDLFAVDGWRASPGVENRGDVDVEAVITGAPVSGRLILEHDAQQQLWRVYDSDGTELGSGSNTIVLEGVTLRLTGQAADGDVLALDFSEGAADMRFLLSEADEIAAAGSTLVHADSSNSGAAALLVSKGPLAEPTGLLALESLFSGTSSAQNAQEFLNVGVIGIVPANASAVELISLPGQSSLAFDLDGVQPSGIQALSFSIGGPAHQFDLSVGAGVDWTDLSELAAQLNDGTLQSATGAGFPELGLYASSIGGQLTLEAATGEFDASATIQTSSSSIAASPGPAQGAASSIQIFTREGRHIAGTPLSASEISGLLTSENGFSAEASYNADYLNLTDDAGYRGLMLERTTPDATENLRLTGLPAEELIVVMTGANTALRLTGAFDLMPSESVDMPQELDVRVADAGLIEIIDPATGQSIATRQLDATGTATAFGLQFSISGQAATGDVFHISAGTTGTGDNRNLEALLDLKVRNQETGRGGFSELFATMVTDAGSQVTSGRARRDTAAAAHEAAAIADSELTDVNLDQEAANLLQQQQAYQASARVLSVARELFDTILKL